MSAETKFTPGPWRIDTDNDVGPNDEGYWEWYQVGPARIDISGKRDFDAEAKANAHLIEAAPDMYQVLERSRGLIAGGPFIAYSPWADVVRAIDEVLAKARGEA